MFMKLFTIYKQTFTKMSVKYTMHIYGHFSCLIVLSNSSQNSSVKSMEIAGSNGGCCFQCPKHELLSW